MQLAVRKRIERLDSVFAHVGTSATGVGKKQNLNEG